MATSPQIWQVRMSNYLLHAAPANAPATYVSNGMKLELYASPPLEPN